MINQINVHEVFQLAMQRAFQAKGLDRFPVTRLHVTQDFGRGRADGFGATVYLMAIGAKQVGQYLLMSGLIGALAVFGGPALIEAVRSIAGH